MDHYHLENLHLTEEQTQYFNNSPIKYHIYVFLRQNLSFQDAVIRGYEESYEQLSEKNRHLVRSYTEVKRQLSNMLQR